jgi:5-methylcytosine-specific restriction enzyme subunit McrC
MVQPPKHPISIDLAEWESFGPTRDPRLRAVSFRGDRVSQALIERLSDRLQIREGFEGVEITSTSYVGQVEVGCLRISVRPKLAALPLTELFRYAYGLRNLELTDVTCSPVVRHGLKDLIIEMLCNEVLQLIKTGLSRRYIALKGNLESPRGRFAIERIAKAGGMLRAELPCDYFERSANWILNRTLLSGLALAAKIADNSEQRRVALGLMRMFGEVDPMSSWGVHEIDDAMRRLTRLTEPARPALVLVRLLLEGIGASLTQEGERQPLPGFLFDMNLFFQRLISRFLHDNLVGHHIADEQAIKSMFSYVSNPKNRKVKSPRPDFALFRGRELRCFLDAKYRDVWEHNCSADWLYQLSMYALCSPTRLSVMLYASMSAAATEERLEVRAPVIRSDTRPCIVAIRPVPLFEMAELVKVDASPTVLEKRRAMAMRLAATN